MKIVKQNPTLLKKELEVKEDKKVKDKIREEYFKRLKEDDKFQQFVIEDVIKRNINNLTDTRMIERSGANMSNKEEIGNLVLISIMSRKSLEKILAELL